MLTNDTLAQWDKDYFFHAATHLGQHARSEIEPRIISSADGVYITDRNGNRFLDAFAGLYCVNIGYGRTEIADAIAKQARELAFYHSYASHATEASITLAKIVVERAPSNMSKVYFGLGGSDANETNVKIVRYYNNIRGRPEKKKIISRWRAYHGSGITSGSLTGLPLYHSKFDLPEASVIHTEAPYYYRREHLEQSPEAFVNHCAEKLEALILEEGSDTIAAMIGEPVLGTGGIVPPPEGYWNAIQAILKKYDILLIVDEVVTGFGRLGEMFASTKYNLDADIISIAKGLTSAYAPLSGSIISDKVWKVLEKGTDENGMFGHGWTYSAHPICAAAGIANLHLIDKLGIVENAKKVGSYLNKTLKNALGDHPHVGEVRGEGMLCAIELIKDKEHRTFYDPNDKVAIGLTGYLASQGLILRAMPNSDVLGLAPPLCLSTSEADIIVEKIVDAIQQFRF